MTNYEIINGDIGKIAGIVRATSYREAIQIAVVTFPEIHHILIRLA